METNKENCFTTKIPVPKDTLPQLPTHLLTKKYTSSTSRLPLKTLNNELSPKAGSSKTPKKLKSYICLNTRHVTVRRGNEDLDWSHNVFEDEVLVREPSDISDHEIFVSDNENTLGAKLPLTPIPKDNLESNRSKNVKRSLKRPHSRELQGLSPLAQQAVFDCKVKRRLQFPKSQQDGIASPYFTNEYYMKCMDRDYIKEIFVHLLNVESKHLNIPRTTNITRACVINWLMKVNGPNGNPSVIQTACWYLDTILGTTYVALDTLQLVAAACYWVAQKFYGPGFSAAKLVRCANNAFTAKRLVAAEKIVLKKMGFTLRPVIVQDYISYLPWCCDKQHGGEIEAAATFLYMCGIMVDKVLCEEYPSVIAIAAVKTALNLLKKKYLLPKLQACHVYKAAEKKAFKMSFTCSVLLDAVQTVASSSYEYKTPLEHFESPPSFIAQRIIATMTPSLL